MMWRKLILIRSGEISNAGETLLQVPYIEEAKHLTIKNIKRYAYITLVAIIRLSVRSENFFKLKYQNLKDKIRNIKMNKKGHLNGNPENKQEVNKFLKMVSEYKQKIRKIKHKIKEEEGNL